MLAALAQHVRIARELARVGVVRKSQFRVEFFCQVLMDFLWYAAHVGVFEVLYLHTPEIAGWNRDEFRVLLGFLFVSDAFMIIWLGHREHEQPEPDQPERGERTLQHAVVPEHDRGGQLELWALRVRDGIAVPPSGGGPDCGLRC